MKTFTVLLLMPLLGCAMQPKPVIQNKLEPFGTPTMSQEQGKAICIPRAELAAKQAKAKQEDSENIRKQRDTTYSCSGSSYGKNKVDVNCNKHEPSGFMEGKKTAERIYAAYNQTYELELSACFAERGWRLTKVCVQNCR